jgi:hypothetical protein
MTVAQLAEIVAMLLQASDAAPHYAGARP